MLLLLLLLVVIVVAQPVEAPPPPAMVHLSRDQIAPPPHARAVRNRVGGVPRPRALWRELLAGHGAGTVHVLRQRLQVAPPPVPRGRRVLHGMDPVELLRLEHALVDSERMTLPVLAVQPGEGARGSHTDMVTDQSARMQQGTFNKNDNILSPSGRPYLSDMRLRSWIVPA